MTKARIYPFRMLINGNIDQEARKASKYLNKLIAEGAKFEIVKKNLRSLSQNDYAHVLFGIWGKEKGLTINEAKVDIKRVLGYVYYRNDKPYLAETHLMTSGELTDFIVKFKNYAATEGVYLPDALEEDRIFWEMQDIEKQRAFL